jgi:phosphoenolpyruvate carboxykinase (ATP)
MAAAIDLRTFHGELSTEELARLAIATGQCSLTRDGALLLRTGKFTGRAPLDRYIVQDEVTAGSVAWGSVNQPLSPKHFHALEAQLELHLATHHTYEVHMHAGGPAGLPLRIVTTSPAHALFSRHLFQAPRAGAAAPGDALTILHDPDFLVTPNVDGTRSGTFIVLHPSAKMILIGGTGYAGEIKKSVFSYLNYVLPERGVFPMHAAVNVGADGDSAIFFGLSGTGKTTLSADPERYLLGDDEHGWSEQGVFNLEGGCYAKTISLSAEQEPDIWRAVHQPLSLIENVVMDAGTGEIDWADASITENTRAAYPLAALGRVSTRTVVAPPKNVIFLTADAFGVLPPVASLSLDQALYYFLSGYTAKLAGTESGQLTPQPTFSTCFGAPFMPRPASVYASLLQARVRAAGARVWLVNTGWVGGAYGEGRRMPIDETRRIVHAILSGEVAEAPTSVQARFGLTVPTAIRGVRSEILDPRSSWSDSARYDQQANMVARLFVENFAKYAADVDSAVLLAGPRLE